MQVRALLQIALCASKVIARNSESAHISKLFVTRADASTIEVSEMALRTHDRMREFELQSESAARNARLDPLTSVYNRDTLLSMLFRETDRVQRMKTLLSLILFGFDDFSSWSSRLGAGACDDLLCQVVGRVPRLLRSYDVLGRVGNDEFLVILPGCWPSACAWTSLPNLSTLRMRLFDFLHALASPPAKAALRWWFFVKRNRRCKAQKKLARVPLHVSGIARGTNRFKSPSCPS